MLCGLLARRWCRRHALQRSPTCLSLTGRRLLGKVHTGIQGAVRLLCGGAVQRSRCGYVLCGGLLCYAHDTAFRTGLQILLDHNILCFSAENSAFSPVRAQYIVVARKNSYFSQKTVRNNRYFSACFCAICTEFGEYAASCAVRCTAMAAVHSIAHDGESRAVSHVLQAAGKLHR